MCRDIEIETEKGIEGGREGMTLTWVVVVGAGVVVVVVVEVVVDVVGGIVATLKGISLLYEDILTWQRYGQVSAQLILHSTVLREGGHASEHEFWRDQITT